MKEKTQNYLENILKKYETNDFNVKRVENHFRSEIAKWGGMYLDNMVRMGSFAQGTAIRKEQDVDVDFLISLQSWIPTELPKIQESLFKYLKQNKYKPFYRNISMRVEKDGIFVDFAPAIKTSDFDHDNHIVYSRKAKQEMPSNPEGHTQIVKRSGRQKEIKLLKIFCMLHGIDELEGLLQSLLTIAALEGVERSSRNNLYENFIAVLQFIRYKLDYIRVVDPFNHEDCLTDKLTQREKNRVIKVISKLLDEDFELEDLLY